jgi:MFS transporter, PAT family, beta-lactamase induction signal transducer AmpG
MNTLTTNKWLRITTLCILYFAQGFPWGFMLTALLSFLASKGLTLAESGQLTAMAYLPWTFKLFWGPIIDSFTYRAMGRRRPWILFAQLGMALTLIAMIWMGDISSNIGLLSWMFFFHNCFASLQDVSCDALAVDILLPKEQGKVNGAMWGSKVIGTGMGAIVMGTLLVSEGLIFAIMAQAILMFIIILFPLLILERPGEKRFPWSIVNDVKPIRNKRSIKNPINVIKDLIHAFSKRPCFFAGLFILISAINQGINSGILPVYYSSTLNWQSDTYSQVSGGPGAILEFFGAILGGILADRFGKRKVFFLGWGSFSVLSGIFGLMILNTEQLPYWFQVFYLVVYPSLIAIGTVSMFALAMALSWSKASATMFTSYMAISNMSVVIGGKLIAPLSDLMSIGQIYILMMFVCLIPVVFLKSMNPRPILNIKLNE